MSAADLCAAGCSAGTDADPASPTATTAIMPSANPSTWASAVNFFMRGPATPTAAASAICPRSSGSGPGPGPGSGSGSLSD